VASWSLVIAVKSVIASRRPWKIVVAGLVPAMTWGCGDPLPKRAEANGGRCGSGERESSLWAAAAALCRVAMAFGKHRLKVADLVAETGVVRRTVQNALVSLTEAGLLQRLGAGPATRYQLIF
jgi:hypothetical protein